MNRTTRTMDNQANRLVATQANRTLSRQTREINTQVNSATSTTSQAGRTSSQKTLANQNVNKQKPPTQNQPKDRLGQAVVSLIFGTFGIIFFIFAILKMDYDSKYSYTTSAGTLITIIFAYILNVVGFILGIRARRSPKGRGMAIAGITLTALPVVVMTLFIVGAVILSFVIFKF